MKVKSKIVIIAPTRKVVKAESNFNNLEVAPDTNQG